VHFIISHQRLSLTLDLKIKLMVSALFSRNELRPVASSCHRGMEWESFPPVSPWL